MNTKAVKKSEWEKFGPMASSVSARDRGRAKRNKNGGEQSSRASAVKTDDSLTP